ncbi:MAG: hypothetical protein NZM00_04880, partial [Anaerolinea sp.]|nr:hypothetical protein [Anaerolinea sp.]
MLGYRARAWLDRLFDLLPPVISLTVALTVSSLLLIAMNADVGTAYAALLRGAFGTENASAETLVKAIPILFV